MQHGLKAHAIAGALHVSSSKGQLPVLCATSHLCNTEMHCAGRLLVYAVYV
jgi:hypothetical protein